MSTAFIIAALLCGTAIICTLVDASIYTRFPSFHKKLLIGLVAACVVSIFLAVFFSIKSCDDYTQSEYKGGDVPIKCRETKKYEKTDLYD